MRTRIDCILRIRLRAGVSSKNRNTRSKTRLRTTLAIRQYMLIDIIRFSISMFTFMLEYIYTIYVYGFQKYIFICENWFWFQNKTTGRIAHYFLKIFQNQIVFSKFSIGSRIQKPGAKQESIAGSAGFFL